MATLVTSGLTGSYATLGGRHVDVDSSGNVWCMLYNLANTRMEFWYSTDSGASFTENTSLRTTVAVTFADRGHAFYIAHSLNGEQVAVWCTAGSVDQTGGYCRSFSTSSTAWTTRDWTNDNIYINNIVAMYDSDSTFDGKPIAVVAWGLGPTAVTVRTTTIPASWSPLSASSSNIAVTGGIQRAAGDFEHTGDGRTATVSGDTEPYLPMSYSSSALGVVFNRWFMGSTRYQNGSQRTLDANNMATTDPIAGVFDGTRYITAFISDTSDTVIQWFERDIADTTTTERTPTALSDGAVTNLAIRHDGTDTILYAVGTTSDDIKKLVYDRTGNSFGSWETLETTNAVLNTLSVQAGYQSADGSAFYCWTHDNGSTYDVYVGLDGPATNKGVPWAGLML